MASRKTFLRAAAAAVLLLALLIGAAAVFLPRLLDSRMVHDTIQREVLQQTGGDVTLARIRFELLPLPRLTVFSPRFVRGETLSVTAERVSIHPRLLPLLIGRVEVARLQITAPSAVLKTTNPSAPGPEDRSGWSAKTAAAALESAIGRLGGRFGDLSAKISRGTLTFQPADGARVGFDQIEAAFSTEPLGLRLTCRSDLFERLELRWTAAGRFPGTAAISVSGLEPAPLVNRLLPESGPVVAAARMDLALDIQPGTGRLPKLSFTGQLPEAVLERQDRRVTVAAASFAGSVREDKERLLLTLDRWEGKQPALGLSAQFVFDRIAGADLSLRQVQARGDQIDVAEVKDPVLFFAAGAPVVGDVFEVLRGGRVTRLRIDSRIPSPRHPFDPADFHLEGEIQDGAVHVPGIDLHLTSVSGGAKIEAGLLTAGKLTAAVDGAKGSDGSLTLSLFDGSNRFALDTRVEAQLSNLAATLSRLIEAPSFDRGLEKIRSLDGTAAGRLRLGERLDDIRAEVDVDRLSATASFSFLPAAVTIAGQGIFYGPNGLSVNSLDLGTDGASVEGISGSLRWDAEPAFDLTAAAADIRVDPVMAWLEKMPAVAGGFSAVSLAGGQLQLSRLKAGGPLKFPARWRYDVAGVVRAVNVETGRLPAPVAVSRLSFAAEPGTVRFDDFDLGFLDAALSGSGSISGVPAAPEEVQIALAGRIGPESDRWVLSRLQVTEQLAFQVRRISDAQLRWKRGAGVDLSGSLALNGDMRLTASVSFGPGRFALNRLLIQDDSSRAEASFREEGSAAVFSYDGRLYKQTVDRLLKENVFLGGHIRGGFRGRVDLASPNQSRIEGSLEVADLTLPLKGGLPLHIAGASLFGEGRRLAVERLDVAVAGEPSVSIGGMLTREPGVFGIDLKLSAERIDLNRLRQAFGPAEPGQSAPKKRGRVPVAGTVAFDAEEVRYDRYRFEDIAGKAVLSPDRTEVTLQRATLCGIALPAELAFHTDSIELAVRPAVVDGRLAEAADCLFEKGGTMEGRFALHGSLSAGGRPEAMASSLQGALTFKVEKGVIMENAGFGILRRILALVNVTEVFAGSMPDFSQSGFRFHSINARADIDRGVMQIRELIVDGINLTLTAQGSVNLSDQALDIVALVAPLKTVDRIVGKIPLVSDILDGALISIPVKVGGTLAEPKVSAIAPAEVGRGLIGITERTLKLPFKMIQPGAPEK